MRFAKKGHAYCLTLISLVGMTGSSSQNVSSTSMGWGAVSPCDVLKFSALGCLVPFFLDLG